MHGLRAWRLRGGGMNLVARKLTNNVRIQNALEWLITIYVGSFGVSYSYHGG
jgi:hypothetical protein